GHPSPDAPTRPTGPTCYVPAARSSPYTHNSRRVGPRSEVAMPSAARAAVLVALLAGLLAPLASAQPDDAKALQQKFQAEREQSVKAKFPAEALARADELARRGEAALKADNPKAAARYFRDARWQLPYLPAGLPEHVVRVFGESRMRHADRVNCLAYSPDGTRLASASRDGTVKVWDLGNGRELVTYRG